MKQLPRALTDPRSSVFYLWKGCIVPATNFLLLELPCRQYSFAIARLAAAVAGG